MTAYTWDETDVFAPVVAHAIETQCAVCDAPIVTMPGYVLCDTCQEWGEPVDVLCDTTFQVEAECEADPAATATEQLVPRLLFYVQAGQYLPAARILSELALVNHLQHREALRQLDDYERGKLARFYVAYLAQERSITRTVPQILHNWSLCAEINSWE